MVSDTGTAALPLYARFDGATFPRSRDPAIEVALRSIVGYVGAMGSRKTHERRAARLRELGIDGGQLARVAAPIGLDVGAKTCREVALSIAAELVMKRRQAHPSSEST